MVTIRGRVRLVAVACAVLTSLALMAGVSRADSFRWTAPYPVDHNALQHLDAVSCPSSTACTAVDQNGGEVTFNPRSATPPSTPRTVDSGQSLSGVACPSSTQCTAVDQNGGEVTFIPTSTKPNNAPRQIDGRGISLYALACRSTSECVAVDGAGNALTGRN